MAVTSAAYDQGTMTVTVTSCAYGPTAHAELAATIERFKQTDRLSPVTVIVPSNHVGIAARRALGRRGGVAAVTFLTPYRVAELLGAATVAATDRRPVSTPVIAGAVRAVLQDDPGQFLGVHTHPATERSLVRAHRALSEVTTSGLERLESMGTRTADVVRVHRAVHERLRPRFSNEQDLVAAAVEAIDSGTRLLRDLGPAVVFMPQRLTSSQRQLLRALGRHTSIEVIAALTGDAEADQPVYDAIAAIDGRVFAETILPVFADQALSVSDADDEVRHSVRTILDAARQGQPLGRCAILYGSPDPYARLLSDALDAAGIAWFGSSVRTADASLLGRSLLALLALPDHNLSRHDVAAWLAGAPIRGTDNRPAPVAAWERASRAAGVVAGLDQWQSRLGRYADDLEADAANLEQNEEHQWRSERVRRDADHARQLVTFVETLAAALQPGGQGSTWAGLAAWCRSLVRTYVGGETLRSGWPDEERAAAQRIDAAIERLGDLDGIDPAPSVAAFRRALELQLADDLGRHGRFGNGVLVGNLGLAVGLELDTVVVVGLAEGSLPARRREDPLLPDRVRAAADGDLALKADTVHDDHRALLAVMAAATNVVFTFPRGDLRRNSQRAPSRWLLDTAEHHDGTRPSADDLARATGDWLTEVPSFIAGLRGTSFPASAQEFDVRAMLDHAESGAEVGTLPLVDQRPELRRGVDLLVGRLSSRFTRFDGNLASDGDLRGVVLPSPADPQYVTSATRLETWAKCPHAFFVRYVLGVSAVEDPEEQYRISPLVLGSLVHDVLDTWIAEAISRNQVPAPGAAWPSAAVNDLLSIAEREASRLEHRGHVGRRVYWGRDRQVFMTDLATFAAFDHQQRAAHSATPIATELAFGMPDSTYPPVAIGLPDGRTLRVRGAIDRVDQTDAGELIVIDYKTGKSKNFEGLSAQDPTPGGTHLQLILYALAAQSVLGRRPGHTRGSYWFVSRKGGFVSSGYPIDSETEALGLHTVSEIVSGIETGCFVAHPAVPKFRPWVDCEFCEPDGLGLSHQYSDWRRIDDTAELQPYITLTGGDRD